MRHCYILRVFTRGGDGGNHLGVVTDVTGLDDEVSQQIATELGFSETVFVDWREGGVPVARIFTPVTEIPFAGHPLVGAGWVLNVAGPGGCDAIACQVGEVGLRTEGDLVWIDPPADQPVTAGEAPDLSGWAEALEAVTVRMPIPYHLYRLASPEAVAALGPPPTDDAEVYAWAWEEDGRSVKARFFAPGSGVAEDPATGSAAVALAAALRHAGADRGEVEIHQGDELGAPSTLHLRWDPDGVSVGGRVVRDEVRVLEQ